MPYMHTHKPTNIIARLALAAMMPLAMAACSGDEADDASLWQGKPVTISVSIAPQGNATRALGDTRGRWQDKNAVDGEMMKNWFVVVAQGNDIKAIIESDYASGEKENDTKDGIEITTGTYDFYSFANIALADVGLTSTSTTLPTDFDSKVYAPAGNKDQVGDFAKGIPMSNKETISVGSSGMVTIKLVRMVAKMNFKFTNDTGEDISINSVQIDRDITDNASSISLLPKYANGSLTPSIDANARCADRTYTWATPLAVANGAKDVASPTIYLNESKARVPECFVVSVKYTKADGTTAVERHAMTEWSDICRNDFRTIPINISSYKVDFKVYSFTGIGLTPVTYQNEDAQLTCNAYNNCEFHIIPEVKDKDGNTVSDWSCQSWTTVSNTGIYTVDPAWDTTTKQIEGAIGSTQGSALHELTIKINPSGPTIAARIQMYRK